MLYFQFFQFSFFQAKRVNYCEVYVDFQYIEGQLQVNNLHQLMMIPAWTTLMSQQRHPNYLIRLPFRQIRASKKSCGPPGFSDLFTYFVTDTRFDI